MDGGMGSERSSEEAHGGGSGDAVEMEGLAEEQR